MGGTDMDYVLPEIPRIHTALAEWMPCMVFILVLHKDLPRIKLALTSVLMLLIQCNFQIFAGCLPLGLWIPSMIAAIIIMLLFIYLSCDLTINDAMYCCIRAFVLAEFAASFEWQIYCFFIYPLDSRWDELWKTIIMLAVYVVVFFLAYRLEVHFTPDNRRMNIRSGELLSAAIIGIAAFTMSNISFVYSNTLFSARFYLEIFIVRTMMDFGGLAVLYAHYILNSELREKQELNAINNVLQRQHEQYEISKDNIEFLNMKYHDFKDQIAVIRAEENLQKKEGYLSDLEKHIKMYEAQNKTGNEVLDTVLTSKNLFCANNDIELTCTVNGALLEFMDVMDISAIFGNALDNAIECEMQIEKKEKRMIHIALFKKKNLLMIRIENYFDGTLKSMVEGIPTTTKADKGYHGYGLKSIRYSVKRYGGSVTVKQENNWFILNILIPMD